MNKKNSSVYQPHPPHPGAWKEFNMNRTTLFSSILLFTAGLLLVLLVAPWSGIAGAEEKASTVALYLQDGESSTIKVTGGREDNATIKFTLTNYEESDPVDRCVLLYVIYMTEEGDGGNWNFSFPDAVGDGEPFYMRKFSGGKELPMFKYVVKGDGAPEPAVLKITHLNNQFPGNARDAINFRLWGLDYDLDSEPTEAGERERFLDKLVEDDSKHNITYLLEDGEHPSTNYDHAQHCYASVITPDIQWQLLAGDSIEMIPGKEYEIPVTVFNYWYTGLPDVVVEATLKSPVPLNHSLRAQPPHQFGEEFRMEEEYEELRLLITISPVQETAPTGVYELEISSAFGEYTILTTTVLMTILNTHGLYLNVSGPDEQIARVDGVPTIFSLQLTNSGNLTDTIKLEMELGEAVTRRASTAPYWSWGFSPTGDIELVPGEVVNVTLALEPVLDNRNIPAGRYPILITARSTSDENKTDLAVVVIRMPLLYDPLLVFPQAQEKSYLQPGIVKEFRFKLTNNGTLEDSFSLDIALYHDTEGVVATLDAPGDWNLSAREFSATAPLDGHLLKPLAPGRTRELLVSLVPPPGAGLGNYTLFVSIMSEGPGEKRAEVTQPCSLAIPDLFMNSNDVVILKKDGTPPEWLSEMTEGEEIIIRATIHLNGSIGTVVKIGFYYKADKEFTLIGEKTVDFGDEAGPDVTRVVELRWKGKPTRTVDIFDNIQVRIDPYDRINESAENNNIGFAGAWFGAKEEEGGGLGGTSPSGFEAVVLVAALLPALVLGRRLKKRRERSTSSAIEEQ